MDLLSNRHVFISYSDEEMLHGYVNSILKQIDKQHRFHEISWSILLQQDFYQEIEIAIENFQRFRQFIDRHDVIAADDSNQQFQHAIYREFMRRQRSKVRLVNKEITFNPFFIMMDDVVHRITVGATKKSTREFLAWFTEGFSVNMHGIFISPSSVRYLLQQILLRTEKEKLRQGNNDRTAEVSPIDSLTMNPGMEIILSGEGLVFFKEMRHHELKKLYASFKEV